MSRHQSDANLYAAMPKDWAACDICKGSRFRVLTQIDRYRMGIQTCQCEVCDLAMTNPMPTEDALRSFYESHYRVYYRRFEKPSPELLKRLGIADRARHSAKFLDEQGALGVEARILDLGCADGSLLRAIKERSPTVRSFGIEPNPAYSQYARETLGAQVWSSLDEVPPSEKFDLVIINHVLEHVRAPSALLARLRTLLTQNASIYVDVPDASRYESLADLHIAHLYHFTAATLESVAACAGLRPRTLVRHDPPNHPLSIRGLFMVFDGAKPNIGADPEGPQVRRSVARLVRRAPIYFARNSWLGRVAIGGPQRLWRAVSS